MLDSIKNLETKWDPGFRIGLGWNIAILGWDLYLHWTYFHNSEVDSTSVDSFHGPIPDIGKNAFINPWVNASFTTFNDLFFNQISTKWKLNLNSIDLELGHKYWLNSTFVMRPYTGMRERGQKQNLAPFPLEILHFETLDIVIHSKIVIGESAFSPEFNPIGISSENFVSLEISKQV